MPRGVRRRGGSLRRRRWNSRNSDEWLDDTAFAVLDGRWQNYAGPAERNDRVESNSNQRDLRSYSSSGISRSAGSIMSSISICSQPPWPAPEPKLRVYVRPYVACCTSTGTPARRARKLSPKHEERTRYAAKRTSGRKSIKPRRTKMFIFFRGWRFY